MHRLYPMFTTTAISRVFYFYQTKISGRKVVRGQTDKKKKKHTHITVKPNDSSLRKQLNEINEKNNRNKYYYSCLSRLSCFTRPMETSDRDNPTYLRVRYIFYFRRATLQNFAILNMIDVEKISSINII